MAIEIELTPDPSGEAEAAAFSDIKTARGDKKYNEEEAKIRIDKIARRLAIFWTGFLWFIILAQATGGGVTWFFGFLVTAKHPFHLEPSEFIAVVTTTTASVFGFLVIVANSVFRKR